MPFTRLRYHIVTATKGRQRFITPEVELVVFRSADEKARELGARLLEINGTDDHIHIVPAIPPSIAVSKFVQDVKAYSSKEVNKAFPRLRFRWQTGYAAFTLSPFDTAGVRAYVRNQKKHHANDDLIDVLEMLEDARKAS